MHASTRLSKAAFSLSLADVVTASAQNPPAYTELSSPEATPGEGFGWDFGYPTHSAGDLNGDGIPELMLGKTCAGQVGQVVFVDGKTGVDLFTLDSPNPMSMGFFGHTLRLLPDLTGDGREEWLIHQQESGSPPAGRVYIFNSQTREVVRTLRNTEAAYPILNPTGNSDGELKCCLT